MGKALELTEARRIEIAESLFTVKQKQGDELHGLCPIHGEKNQSFSYNVAKDAYHCLACLESGDLIKLYCVTKGLDPNAGFKEFCLENGLGGYPQSAAAGIPTATPTKKDTPKKADPEPVKEMDLTETWKSLPPLPDTWIDQLIKTRGWTREAIERLGIKMVMRNGSQRIAIPVTDGRGVVRNIRLYLPGAKEGKVISWDKGSGKNRLFPAYPSDSGSVILCEGEPDAICAISKGLNGITQTAKVSKWDPAQIAVFADRDVVVAYDADEAGKKYALSAVANLRGAARSVRVIAWPEFMTGTDDLTDFFNKHGKSARDFEVLIEKAALVDRIEYDPSEVLMYFAQGPGENSRISFKSRLLADKLMADDSFLHEGKTSLMYRWNGRYWDGFDDSVIKMRALECLGIEGNKSRAEDVAYQVRYLSTIPHGRAINDRPDEVCLQNGVLNLRSMELRNHVKEDYFTYALGLSFDPTEIYHCPRWTLFLEETLQDEWAITLLQEFFGYCLVNDTRYQKALILLGPGADGKTLTINMLQKLVGMKNCSAIPFSAFEDQFQRAALYQKRLNVSTEVGSGMMESAIFKAIVSGDMISASFKFKDPFPFTPYAKLIFATNVMPRIKDSSDGLYRRLIILPYHRQFLGDDRDSFLDEKLTAELPGIMAWALLGLHRLLGQGQFSETDESAGQVLKYRVINNPVLAFVMERCDLGDGYTTAKMEIYNDYRQFCSDGGYKMLNAVNFFKTLYDAVATLRRTRRRRDGELVQSVDGIALKPMRY